MSTDTAATSALASEGAGPNPAQAANVTAAATPHRGHEPGGDRVRNRLDRRPRPAGGGHERRDASGQRLRSDAVRPHRERPGPVHGPAADLVPGAALDRDRLPGEHRFVDAGRAVEHRAVGRDVLSGTYAETVAGRDAIERDLAFLPVGVDPTRDGGREGQEAADRVSRSRPRAKLQHLAQDDQGHDDRGGLEVEGRSAVDAERLGEQVREQQRGRACKPCRAGAGRHQGEHVELAGDQRRPAAGEERRSAPQHHRGGERRLDPSEPHRPEPAPRVERGDHLAHGDREDRQGQGAGDHEPAAHVRELRAPRIVGRRRPRLQCHAALRAVSRGLPDDLRMHGTDMLGARRCERPRLQRHAALGAVRGDVAAHLGMAGTGVVGPGGRRRGRVVLHGLIPGRCGSGMRGRGALMARGSGRRGRGCGGRMRSRGGRRRVLDEAGRPGLEPFPAGLSAEPVAAPAVARGRAGTDPFDDGAAYGILRVGVTLGRGQKPVLAPEAAKAHRGSVVHAGHVRGGRIRLHPAHRVMGGGRSRVTACLADGDAHRVALSMGRGKARPSSSWKVKGFPEGGETESTPERAGRGQHRPGYVFPRVYPRPGHVFLGNVPHRVAPKRRCMSALDEPAVQVHTARAARSERPTVAAAAADPARDRSAADSIP